MDPMVAKTVLDAVAQMEVLLEGALEGIRVKSLFSRNTDVHLALEFRQAGSGRRQQQQQQPQLSMRRRQQ